MATLVKKCKGIKEGESGIRLNHVKYMFQSNMEEDDVKFLRLTCKGGGGATVALTTYAIIVGTF